MKERLFTQICAFLFLASTSSVSVWAESQERQANLRGAMCSVGKVASNLVKRFELEMAILSGNPEKWAKVAKSYLDSGEREKASAIYAEAGMWEEAARALFEVPHRGPDVVKYYLKANKIDFAIDAYRIVNADAEDLPHLRDLKLEIEEIADRFERLKALNRAAETHRVLGNFEKAASLFMKAHDPVSAARAYLDARKPDLAVSVVRKALSSGKQYENLSQDYLRAFLGSCLLETGQKSEAAEHFRAGRYWAEYGHLLEEMGRAEEFVSILKNERAKKPADLAKINDVLVGVYSRQKRYEEAAELFLEQGNPLMAAHYLGKAGEFEKQGRVLEAAKEYDEAVRAYLMASGGKKAFDDDIKRVIDLIEHEQIEVFQFDQSQPSSTLSRTDLKRLETYAESVLRGREIQFHHLETGLGKTDVRTLIGHFLKGRTDRGGLFRLIEGRPVYVIDAAPKLAHKGRSSPADTPFFAHPEFAKALNQLRLKDYKLAVDPSLDWSGHRARAYVDPEQNLVFVSSQTTWKDLLQLVRFASSSDARLKDRDSFFELPNLRHKPRERAVSAERTGDLETAARIHEGIGNIEKAGDLYTKAGFTDEAERVYKEALRNRAGNPHVLKRKLYKVREHIATQKVKIRPSWSLRAPPEVEVTLDQLTLASRRTEEMLKSKQLKSKKLEKSPDFFPIILGYVDESQPRLVRRALEKLVLFEIDLSSVGLGGSSTSLDQAWYLHPEARNVIAEMQAAGVRFFIDPSLDLPGITTSGYYDAGKKFVALKAEADAKTLFHEYRHFRRWLAYERAGLDPTRIFRGEKPLQFLSKPLPKEVTGEDLAILREEAKIYRETGASNTAIDEKGAVAEVLRRLRKKKYLPWSRTYLETKSYDLEWQVFELKRLLKEQPNHPLSKKRRFALAKAEAEQVRLRFEFDQLESFKAKKERLWATGQMTPKKWNKLRRSGYQPVSQAFLRHRQIYLSQLYDRLIGIPSSERDARYYQTLARTVVEDVFWYGFEAAKRNPLRALSDVATVVPFYAVIYSGGMPIVVFENEQGELEEYSAARALEDLLRKGGDGVIAPEDRRQLDLALKELESLGLPESP
ncbi:MAG: hypothetical protein AB1540_06120 [Bdellovibrionota bacterium]